MQPNNAITTVRLIPTETQKIPPKITISSNALKWIEKLTELHDHEVGFYGVVDKTGDNEYYVRDIFYPKHDLATTTTCEISAEGTLDMMKYLIAKGRSDDIDNSRFWGHSHHNGGVFASGQDETQAMETMNRAKDFLIRAICNTHGDMSISFFDYEKKLQFDNVRWIAESEDESTYMQKIDSILSVLRSNSNPKNKIKAILSSISHDHEMKQIEEKIEELKKVNMPKGTKKSFDAFIDDESNDFDYTEYPGYDYPKDDYESYSKGGRGW